MKVVISVVVAVFLLPACDRIDSRGVYKVTTKDGDVFVDACQAIDADETLKLMNCSGFTKAIFPPGQWVSVTTVPRAIIDQQEGKP